jgi:hypothetical protein
VIDFEDDKVPPPVSLKISLGANDFTLTVETPDFAFLRKAATLFGEERCDHLLKLISDWEGVTSYGSPLTYSPTNFQKLCLHFPAVYRETILKITEHLDRHRLSETDAKN